MEYKLKVYNIYEAGQRFDHDGVPHQEDSIFPAYGCCAEQDRLYVVCDGMGGHDNGEIASRVVCDTLSSSIINQLRHGSGQFRENIFDRALADAYDALDANDTNAPKKMGTTMAMLMLYEKGFFAAHIGDSRVYQIRPGADAETTQIVFCTSDHSLVNSLVRSGKMSYDEAVRQANNRHVITRAMQPYMEYRPGADVEMSSDIRKGDYFMVCSHGMIENMSDDTIRYIFSAEGGNDRNKFNHLVKATAANADNHSAIIVHVLDVAQHIKQEEQQPKQAPRQKRAPMVNPDTRLGKTARKMTDTTRRFIDRRRQNNDTGRLIARFLLALMGLLIVIMIVYYAFVRHNEVPPEAGKAIDPIENESNGTDASQEIYGYETSPSTPTDDENVGNGQSEEETAKVEVTEETNPDEVQPETVKEEEPAPKEEPSPKQSKPEPEPTADPGPILQE